MRILVCIKQVPDTAEVKLDPVTNNLIREGVPSIINHDDKSGLEAALRLREELNDGTTVGVVSMGPPQADVALREALAMGADKAYLVSAREFGGSDTYATATIISAALDKIGYDLVITGRQAIDGDTAQVGPQIAEQLDLPQVSYAQDIEYIKGENALKVKRQFEDKAHIVKIKLPCLITAMAELAEPRYMNVGMIVDAYNTDIEVIGYDDLKDMLNPEWIGNARTNDAGDSIGSPTNVVKSFTKPAKTAGTVMKDLTPDQAAEAILNKLIERHLV